ncbi:hypothetical protein J3F83DRAFT_743436 [Trichoderma novae-zelandiae]
MSSPPPPSSPSASLSPLLPILNAFNHRHHNQHRLAHWWPVFRILRRTLRALVDDLAPSSSPSSSSSSSRRRRDASSSSPPPRAIWLGKHFVPRAYIAFSQLAADNQHAPLGLLLLAILSRVHAVLAQLLDHSASTSTTPLTKPVASSSNRSIDATNQDKGIAISRQEHPLPTQPTERLRMLQATSTRPSSDEPLSRDFDPDSADIKPSDPKSKDEAAAAAASTRADKKKKKKKGKGDELSSLFGSLA